jgi:hypothetical protein
MATTTQSVVNTAYVQIFSGTDALIQNVSPANMYVVFGAEPAVDSTIAHTLARGQAIQVINSVPAGVVWARMTDLGKEGTVAVSGG